MPKLRFDWSWVAVIVVLVVLANAGRLPWPATALVAGAAGAWLLVQGWRVWQRAGGPPARGRVTYWRGQRIELEPPRRGPALPNLRDIGPAMLYFIFGGLFVLVALGIALRGLNL